MRRKIEYLISILTVAAALASCGRGIVKDAPVKLVHPQKELSLTIDPTLNSDFEECQQIYQMNIVSDSILVCGEQGTHEGDFFFKAYSCNTLQYLGAFIRKGRADGEFLHPRAVSRNNCDESLFLMDKSLNADVAVDVEASVGKPLPVFRTYPSETESVWEWLPLSDSMFFIGQQEKDDELTYKVVDIQGNAVKEYHPFKGIDCMTNATCLSELLLGNPKQMKVAQVMLYFPQINIYDLEKETIFSYAVDKDYRKWNSVVDRNMGMETMSYYKGATASPDYIFASYAPMSISQMLSKELHGTSIHIFDWEGSWLYNIKVEECVEAMAYDGAHKFLYAVDNAEGRIVRYALGDILQ